MPSVMDSTMGDKILPARTLASNKATAADCVQGLSRSRTQFSVVFDLHSLVG